MPRIIGSLARTESFGQGTEWQFYIERMPLKYLQYLKSCGPMTHKLRLFCRTWHPRTCPTKDPSHWGHFLDIKEHHLTGNQATLPGFFSLQLDKSNFSYYLDCTSSSHFVSNKNFLTTMKTHIFYFHSCAVTTCSSMLCQSVKILKTEVFPTKVWLLKDSQAQPI